MVQKLPSASVLGVTNGRRARARGAAPGARGGERRHLVLPARHVRPERPAQPRAGADRSRRALGAPRPGRAACSTCAPLFIAAVSVAVSLILARAGPAALGYTLNALVVLGLLARRRGARRRRRRRARGNSLRALRRRSADGSRLPVQPVIVEASPPAAKHARLRDADRAAGAGAGVLRARPDGHLPAPDGAGVRPGGNGVGGRGVDVDPALAMLLFERGAPRGRGHAAGARRAAPPTSALAAGALAIPRARPGGGMHRRAGRVRRAALPARAGAATLPGPQPRRAVERADGRGLTEMDRVTGRVIADLRALPAVADAAATLGRAVSARPDRRRQLGADLRRRSSRARTTTARCSAVRAIVGAVPGMRRVGLDLRGGRSGGRAGSGQQPRSTVRVYGESYGELRAPGARVGGEMARVERTRAAAAAAAHGGAEHRGRRSTTREAHNAGVLPGDARRQASTLVSGLTVGNFFEDQAVFDVVVMEHPVGPREPGHVRNLLIDTAGGGHVPLSSIATVGVRADPMDIQHEALSRYVDVTVPVCAASASAAGLGDRSTALEPSASRSTTTPRSSAARRRDARPRMSSSCRSCWRPRRAAVAAPGGVRELAAGGRIPAGAAVVALAGGLVVLCATGQARFARRRRRAAGRARVRGPAGNGAGRARMPCARARDGGSLSDRVAGSGRAALARRSPQWSSRRPC